jgi:hypothetical protein
MLSCSQSCCCCRCLLPAPSLTHNRVIQQVGNDLQGLTAMGRRWMGYNEQQDAHQALAAQQELLDRAGHLGQLVGLVTMGLVALRAGRLWEVHQVRRQKATAADSGQMFVCQCSSRLLLSCCESACTHSRLWSTVVPLLCCLTPDPLLVCAACPPCRCAKPACSSQLVGRVGRTRWRAHSPSCAA